MTVPQYLPPVPNSMATVHRNEQTRLRKNRKSRARHRKIAKLKKHMKAQQAAHDRWLNYAYGPGY